MTPGTIEKFRKAGDTDSVDMLQVQQRLQNAVLIHPQAIYEEEITHVAAGLKWFKYTCGKSEDTDELKVQYIFRYWPQAINIDHLG